MSAKIQLYPASVGVRASARSDSSPGKNASTRYPLPMQQHTDAPESVTQECARQRRLKHFRIAISAHCCGTPAYEGTLWDVSLWSGPDCGAYAAMSPGQW
jgi:hypothetical protein